MQRQQLHVRLLLRSETPDVRRTARLRYRSQVPLRQSNDSTVLFYDSIFSPIVDLFYLYEEDRASRGSGRPPGPVQEKWRSLIARSFDALRSGLEVLLVHSQLDRIIEHPRSDVDPTGVILDRVATELRDLIQLPAPDSNAIEDALLLQFGIARESILIPDIARFTAKSKPLAWEGAGRGQPVPFEHDWEQLSAILNTVMNVLTNIDAHRGDSIPPTASALSEQMRGSLWATTKGGEWTVQIPHAATALRTCVAVFNSACYSLEMHTQGPATIAPNHLSLRSPDDVVKFS